MISIVIGDVSNPFYPSALEVFAKEASARKYDMLVHVVPSGETVDTTIARVLSSGSDAVVVASANLSSDLARRCRLRGMPVVLFNRVQTDPDANAVCADNYNGGILAANRLLSRECKAIAFLGGARDTSTHLERRRGFLDELERNDACVIFDGTGEYSYDVAFSVISKLLNGRETPDGLFCANDIMAIAAIDAAKQYGIVPGQDISIIGFDDVPMAAWTSYRLTTFRQRIGQMVSSTLNLIENYWQNPDTAGTLQMIRCGLIERESG